MKQNIKNYNNYSDYSQKNIQKLLYIQIIYAKLSK